MPGSFAEPEIDDIVPNFTPPSIKGINLDNMRAELHEEKAPGTPDISVSKPRHKIMRARDSIGVAKFHLGKKFTRDESMDQSPSRSVRVTNQVGTPTSGRMTRSQSKNIAESNQTGNRSMSRTPTQVLV